jgi:replicative DNA helicase
VLERQVIRLGGIDGTTLRDRVLTGEQVELVEKGLDALEPIRSRLAFVTPPFDMLNIGRAAGDHDADLIVLDYLQRISPTKESAEAEGRQRMVALMNDLRRAALEGGIAILAIAAVGRQRTKDGSTGYSGLSLSSFRDSGEIEYGADEAFVMEMIGDRSTGRVRLEHLKARDGDVRSVNLLFDRPRQSFTIDDDQGDPILEPVPPRGGRPGGGGGGGRRRAAEERADATPPDVLDRIAGLRAKSRARRDRKPKASPATPQLDAESVRLASENQWNDSMRRAVWGNDTDGHGDDTSDTGSDGE